MGQTPSRRVSSSPRACFNELCAVCDCLKSFSCAGRRHKRRRPCAGSGRLSIPGCCRGSGQVIRRRAALSRQQRSRARARQFSLPARACAATPLVAAVRLCSAGSPACRNKMQANSGTAWGRGFSIARRLDSAVCLVVYKGTQFRANSMQSAAKQELPEKSSACGEQRPLGRLTRAA
jgi:hypothetical protein